MVKVRTLITLQGKHESYTPRKVFDMEKGKELDRLLKNGFVELFGGDDLPESARFVESANPPPKFEDGIEDGAQDKTDGPIIVKKDPGDVDKPEKTPPPLSKKKGKK